jgi:Fic family protein
MSLVFESVIKVDENNEWFIELTDTSDGRVEICKNMDEYKENFEKMGEDYGGNVDEVRWSQDDNVPPFHIDEIRQAMANLQAEVEEKQGRPLMDDKE